MTGPVVAVVLWRGPCGRLRLEWQDERDLRACVGLGPLRLTWVDAADPDRVEQVDEVDVYGQTDSGLVRGRTRRRP